MNEVEEIELRQNFLRSDLRITNRLDGDRFDWRLEVEVEAEKTADELQWEFMMKYWLEVLEIFQMLVENIKFLLSIQNF